MRNARPRNRTRPRVTSNTYTRYYTVGNPKSSGTNRNKRRIVVNATTNSFNVERTASPFSGLTYRIRNIFAGYNKRKIRNTRFVCFCTFVDCLTRVFAIPRPRNVKRRTSRDFKRTNVAAKSNPRYYTPSDRPYVFRKVVGVENVCSGGPESPIYVAAVRGAVVTESFSPAVSWVPCPVGGVSRVVVQRTVVVHVFDIFAGVSIRVRRSSVAK